MKPSSKQYRSLCSLLILVVHMSAHASAGSQFSSHISVNTPARSYTHGVGDPLPVGRGATYHQKPNQNKPSFRTLRRFTSQNHKGGGYPRVRPTVPFNNEERPYINNFKTSTWHLNDFQEINIPILPPSPYKVDSPDPESLWPEGLFLPPIKPLNFGSNYGQRSDDEAELDLDPYLIEGTEAIAAVKRAKGHGHLYFHEIPHINSLLANQELRQKNNLKPHRLGSIRQTWPYNRP
ncbi:uncharacterized protein LOC113235467 [Hyposmocoma kahamanoa]|uniref:uncharacterized protein LOC113235467 n=1 Tax=Hyposmocoma kahamanoa TaxID=1477025 RepID=UPI000E6D65F1|nr:uncharacterized protein LOC113235467 [Hyposmocoma kahamanoa]